MSSYSFVESCDTSDKHDCLPSIGKMYAVSQGFGHMHGVLISLYVTSRYERIMLNRVRWGAHACLNDTRCCLLESLHNAIKSIKSVPILIPLCVSSEDWCCKIISQTLCGVHDVLSSLHCARIKKIKTPTIHIIGWRHSALISCFGTTAAQLWWAKRAQEMHGPKRCCRRTWVIQTLLRSTMVARSGACHQHGWRRTKSPWHVTRQDTRAAEKVESADTSSIIIRTGSPKRHTSSLKRRTGSSKRRKALQIARQDHPNATQACPNRDSRYRTDVRTYKLNKCNNSDVVMSADAR